MVIPDFTVHDFANAATAKSGRMKKGGWSAEGMDWKQNYDGFILFAECS